MYIFCGAPSERDLRMRCVGKRSRSGAGDHDLETVLRVVQGESGGATAAEDPV